MILPSNPALLLNFTTVLPENADSQANTCTEVSKLGKCLSRAAWAMTR